jgi:hypothetical protein
MRAFGKEVYMTTTVWGVVKDGCVVPNSPLPEGASVEIRLCDSPEVSAELQAELDAWQQSSAEAQELVERIARSRV